MRTSRRIFHAAALCLAAIMPLTTLGATSTTVRVLSAISKDKAIGNAHVIFQRNGWNSVSGTTDADGRLRLGRAPFRGVDDESVLMIVTKRGYSSLVVKCPCDGMTYALSEKMSELDGIICQGTSTPISCFPATMCLRTLATETRRSSTSTTRTDSALRQSP